MRSLVSILTCLVITGLCAQNLVVNPGFETFKKEFEFFSNTSTIPDDAFTRYGINGWYQPTKGSSDWYCNITNDSNPIPAGFRRDYFGGKVDPHTGRAFGGIIVCDRSLTKPYAEYLAGSLMSTLIPGHTYTMSFWIQIGHRSTIKTEQIDVLFSSDQIDSSRILGPLQLTPQLIFKLDAVNNWTLMSAEFVAQGTEKYFILGNFKDAYDSSTSYRGVRRKLLENQGYYYFDDFSIVDKNPAGPITITAGSKLICQNILFESAKTTIEPSSFASLDQVVVALKKQSTLKVEISDHADKDRIPESNQTLSEQRALAVKEYFISKGIDSTRITTIGYGSSKPISSDKSKNRRVEFYFSE